MAVTQLAKRFLSASAKGQLDAYMNARPLGHLFRNAEKALHEQFDGFVVKHAALPSLDLLNEWWDDVPSAPEPASYYLDAMRNRYMEMYLSKVVSEANELVGQGKCEDAAGLIVTKLMPELVKQHGSRLINMAESYDLVRANYFKQMKMGDEYGVKLGYPVVDDYGGLVGGDVLSIVGRPAAGKAQPLTEPVALADGSFTLMGNLKPGDALASVDGQPSVVVALHPQGTKKVYRIKFRDGRETRATADHLWSVSSSRWKTGPKLLTTEQLIAEAAKARQQMGVGTRLAVELPQGHFDSQGSAPVSPWLIGLLLGDGGLTNSNIVLTTADRAIEDRVNSEVRRLGLYAHPTGKFGFRIVSTGLRRKGCNPVREALAKLGCIGKKSTEKELPAAVFGWPRSERLEFLRGLMDADGWAEKGSAVLCSSSPALARGALNLARSLGFVATIATASNSSWRVRVLSTGGDNPFWLPRKAALVDYSGPHRLLITSIEEDGEEECQCVTVSHPSHLYLTRDYVVTHNSFLQLRGAHRAWRGGKRSAFLSMEMNNLISAQRLIAMDAGVPLNALKMQKGQGLTTAQMKKLNTTMASLDAHAQDFFLMDGNLSTTVEDIYGFCRMMRPDVLFIDGAYMLKHPNPRLGRFERVAENCELIKQRIAGDLGIPVCASWQFSRDAAKKMKGGKQSGKVDLEDIGYSDAIGQISSIVLGLLGDETVETLQRKKVTIMKGRSGETGDFWIRWEFHPLLNFDHHVEEEVGDLQFVV